MRKKLNVRKNKKRDELFALYLSISEASHIILLVKKEWEITRWML